MKKEKLIFLALSAALLLGAVRLLPNRMIPLDQITLAVASDLHYIAPALTDGGLAFQSLTENGDGKCMEHCEIITDTFIRQIVAQKPDALILSGDLSFNGERLSHEDLAKKLRVVRNAGIPVLVLPGNHDIEYPMAASYHGDTYEKAESVTAEEFERIYGQFGFADALSRDTASLSYTTALSSRLWALMVDVNTTNSPGAVKPETVEWVRERLEEAKLKGIRVIAVSHQPVYTHNSTFSESFTMKNGRELEALYRQYTVICCFCGHIHIQHIAGRGTSAPEIASSALITWPNQYGLLTLKGVRGQYRTVTVEPSQEVTEDAYRMLWNTAYRQAGAELTSGATVASGIDGLCSFYAGVNVRYVAGLEDEIEWDDAAMREWQVRGALLAAYLQSIADDGSFNQTEYAFSFQ